MSTAVVTILRLSVLLLIALSLKVSAAQSLEAWQDINVIQKNTLPPRASFHAYESKQMAALNDPAQSRYFQSLNGDWYFTWAESPSERPADFWQQNYDVSEWARIRVPSVWEREGYGYPIYINHGYPFNAKPFEVPVDKQNHVGSYVRYFDFPSSWNGRRTIIQLGAVSSAFTLWVNGKEVGYSQGSRTPAEFDITDFVMPGSNKVAVEVMRWSDASWLENQDSWSLSGIFRDVFLYSRSNVHINDYFAKTFLTNKYSDGLMELAVDLQNHDSLVEGWSVEYGILKDQKLLVSGVEPVNFERGKAAIAAQLTVDAVQAWSAETPSLYDLRLVLYNAAGDVVEVIQQKTGFRSVEKRHGRVLINGKAIKFKGVNVHEFHDETGYVVDRETLIKDFTLMKAANINAVRTSHYPQATEFYQLANEYGFYVIDEANMETHLFRNDPELAPARKPEWAKQMLDRTVRMVERDKNHPSIVFWSPANETGMGENMTAIYQWTKKRDPSRLFQYADDTFVEGEGVVALNTKSQYGVSSDVLTAFYPSYWELARFAQTHNDQSWIMAEYWHSMGNSMGNGKAYWGLINQHSNLQGGFIWDWVDQGLKEQDEQGNIWWGHGGDYGPKGAPSSANFVHNGIVFPDRRVKPAYWEIKRAHQSVHFEAYDLPAGKLWLSNRFNFIDLSQFDLSWTVTADGEIVRTGEQRLPDVSPSEKVLIQLDDVLPGRLKRGAEYHLNIALRGKRANGLLPAGHIYANEQFLIPVSRPLPAKPVSGVVKDLSTDNDAIFKAKETEVRFDRNTGLLTSFRYKRQELLQSSPKPNLWRAMTDNDYGQLYDNAYGYTPATWDLAWRSAGENRQLTDMKVAYNGDGSVVITTKFDLFSDQEKHVQKKIANYDIDYTFQPSGLLNVNVHFVRAEGVSMPMRVGMRLQLNDALSTLQWFGRGPHENYADRNWSAHVGLYTSSVTDQYVPYLRPQENGYKTDVRWMTLTASNEVGLAFIGAPQFSFSALPNPLEDYEADDAVIRANIHTVRDEFPVHVNDIPVREGVYVHIDQGQVGVGGDNSWGKRAHNAFALRESEYSYQFSLSGIDGANNAAQKVRTLKQQR